MSKTCPAVGGVEARAGVTAASASTYYYRTQVLAYSIISKEIKKKENLPTLSNSGGRKNAGRVNENTLGDAGMPASAKSKAGPGGRVVLHTENMY